VSTDSSHSSLTNTQLLSQQLSQLIALEAVIDDEKHLLQGQDPILLSQISEDKNQLLLAIDSLDKLFAQRVNFFKEKQAGLHEQQLTEIESALIRCKNKNTVNGQIIQHSQLAIERMKTSLLQQHNKSSITYDSKGKTSGGLNSLGIKA
jgi:flagella synthesis protein FlgN